jgi:hypothetical protein
VNARARTGAFLGCLSRAGGPIASSRRHVFALLALLASIAVFAPSASAGYVELGAFADNGPDPGGAGSADGQLRTPGAADVRTSTSKLYVADTGNNRVEVFSQTPTGGEYDSQVAISAPTGLAIDQSTGDVYVSNASGIAKFDQNLDPAAGWIDPGVTGTLAVDPTSGDLLVADRGANLIRRFSSAGTPGATFAAERPVDLAVDSTGKVYVVTSTGDITGGCDATSSVWRFSSNGSTKERIGQSLVVPGAVAVDLDDDSILIATHVNEYFCEAGFHPQITSFDRWGAFIHTFELTDNTEYAMVPGLAAAGGGSPRAYAVTTSPGEPQYGNTKIVALEYLPPAGVTIEPVDAGTVTTTEATFEGSVDPNGLPTSWHFEYRIVGKPSWLSSPTEDAGSGNDPQDVVFQASHLDPNSEYEVRLVAVGANGQSTSEPPNPTFTTPISSPFVIAGTNTPAGDGRVVIRGYVNPVSSDVTSCRFEFGLTMSYGSSIPCEQSPGSGNEAVLVTAELSGLTAGTLYHFRLEASSIGGTSQSDDASFLSSQNGAVDCSNRAALGASFLPGCRAWEMVSPREKNGGDITPDSGRTRAAADGSAIGFTSLAGFGDLAGTGVRADYMAVRSLDPSPGTSGWATHGVTPRKDPSVFQESLQGVEPQYVGEFSDDLRSGIYFSSTPITDDPNVANAYNLYRRNDLRTPGAGHYELLSSCPLCAATETPLASSAFGFFPELAGATPDFGRAIFESERRLTEDAPATAGPFLYEWDEGELRLSGRIPVPPETECDDSGGSSCTAADVSLAGQGVGGSASVSSVSHDRSLTLNTISDGSDGHSRVFFTHPLDQSGTVTKAEAYEGNVYMRVDGHETAQLNASERGDPAPFQLARFQDASSDGTRIFFSSAQALTDSAPVEGVKLYMYDASKPASADNLTLVNVDDEPKDEASFLGFIGRSDDGHYAYILDDAQLVDNAPLPEFDGIDGVGIYRWHDGELAYVGAIPKEAEALNEIVVSGTQVDRLARVSPDGRHLLFSALRGAGLTGYDHGSCITVGNGCREYYVYDDRTNSLQCASCLPSGAPPTTMARTWIQKDTGGSRSTWHQANTLSDDGRYVFFSTEERLVSEDTNGTTDAYVFDVTTGKPGLLSSGNSAEPAFFLDASATGRDAFIITREPISGWDIANAYDIYDARVNGGFPEPPPPPPSCVGDACQPPPLALDDATPASSGFRGSGNPSANRRARCTKGRRRTKTANGKTRCVKRKAHKRNANNNRRPGK